MDSAAADQTFILAETSLSVAQQASDSARRAEGAANEAALLAEGAVYAAERAYEQARRDEDG
jgi:hypothetical protein